MADLNITTFVERPPTRLYEVRTIHGEAYRAEGDVIESGDGWFTLWSDESTITLRVPEADVRALRQLAEGELEAQAEDDLAEARQWARHGYEIGQRHCSWTDHGVAPAWLTEGWPRHFDSCEHLKQAAELDEALSRVRALSESPEVMNADQPSPEVWRHGYRFGVLAAKSATRPRDEKTSKR